MESISTQRESMEPGRQGLEGSQMRIGSVSKRREWKLSHFKVNLVKKVSG
jgi:hypothetical protein